LLNALPILLRLTGSRAGPVASGRPAGPGRGRPGPPAPGTAASVDARAEVVGRSVEEADVLVAGGADVHRVHPVDDVEAARQAALRHADQHRAGDGPELGAVAPELDQGGAARVGVAVGAGLRGGDAYDQVALVRDPPGRTVGVGAQHPLHDLVDDRLAVDGEVAACA